MRKNIFEEKKYQQLILFATVLLVSFFFPYFSLAEMDSGAVIKEAQVVEINKSLKNVIEENQNLSTMNRQLMDEVQELKGRASADQQHFDELKKDRDDLSQTIEKVRGSNRQYSAEIKKLESDVKELQTAKNEYNDKAAEMEEKLSMQGEGQKSDQVMIMASVTDEEVKKREEKTVGLLTKIDAFAEKDEQLRSDSAKAHYNMGNIYFEKGEYEIAAREYYQAVTLMPDDPDAHYNLAFVCGEHLKDFKSALKHYQMYLYLSPNASDADLVKEKIVHAKLELRNTVDSFLEKDQKQ